jgi:hypothetical protein
MGSLGAATSTRGTCAPAWPASAAAAAPPAV